MSLLQRIRNLDSKISTNRLSISTGIVFLAGGLTSLFSDPTGFINDQTMLFGSCGATLIPKIISLLLGWTLLSYGILNQINFSGFEKRRSFINRLPFRKTISPKNTIFIISSFLFILIIASIFILIRPDKEIKARNEEFNKSLRKVNKIWEHTKKNR